MERGFNPSDMEVTMDFYKIAAVFIGSVMLVDILGTMGWLIVGPFLVRR